MFIRAFTKPIHEIRLVKYYALEATVKPVAKR